MFDEAIIKVINIKKIFHTANDETEAIKDVSFSIKDGEFVSLVGPSGCGKSTLLSIINELIKPSGGMVLKKPGIKIGYMLQKDYLFEWRSVFKNITLGLEIQRNLNEKTIEYTNKLLKKYGLYDFRNHKPSELSGGMRQRAALIRTLVQEPDVLLLDEPFSALDYQTRLSVADEIGTIIKTENKTALLITHDLSEALSLSDRIIVLSKRPSMVKNIHELKFSMDSRTPLKTREAVEFREYFNLIWKELDVHV